MKSLVFITLLISTFSFAQTSPKVSCTLQKYDYTAEGGIPEGADLNLLLGEDYEVITVAKTKSADADDVQSTDYSDDNVYYRYYHNTQSGAVELEDKNLKITSYSPWTKTIGVNGTGRLAAASTELISLKGNLAGNPNTFILRLTCY